MRIYDVLPFLNACFEKLQIHLTENSPFLSNKRIVIHYKENFELGLAA